MTLFKLWYLGMTLVVIIQQITIWYLVRKLGGREWEKKQK